MENPFTWDVQMVQPSPEPSVQPVSTSEPAVSQPPPSPSAVTRPVRRTQVVTRRVHTISSEQQREIRQRQAVSVPRPHTLGSVQLPIQQASAAIRTAQPISSTDAPQDRVATVMHRETASTGMESRVQHPSVSQESAEIPATQMAVKQEETRRTDESVSTSLERHVVVERQAVEHELRTSEQPESLRPAEVTTIAARAVGPAQAHYGWLKDDLRERIERVKHYPQVALDRRWEGRVIVRAVIWADGRLSDLSVLESSGYDELDREALDLLQRISPLQLKHALGAPQITLRIPINYGMR